MQNVAVAVAIAAAVAILAVDVVVVLVAVLLLLLLRHALPLPALMRLRLLLLLLELEAVVPLAVQCSRAAVSTVVGSRVEAVNASEDWLIHQVIPKRNRSAGIAALADCAPTLLGSQLEKQMLRQFRRHCCCYSAGIWVVLW